LEQAEDASSLKRLPATGAAPRKAAGRRGEGHTLAAWHWK
jgi:hypothetical protein